MSGSYSVLLFHRSFLIAYPRMVLSFFSIFRIKKKDRSVGNARVAEDYDSQMASSLCAENRYEKSPVSESYCDVIH